MADQRATCGKITITYPGTCSYVCYCTPQGGCNWAVTCGDWTTGGQGLTVELPHPSHVSVRGQIEACAKILEKGWKRKVTVPDALRGKVLKKRSIDGTQEEIAKALGLKLGPVRKATR